MPQTRKYTACSSFGSYLAGTDRKDSEAGYQYGFNGKRKDDEMHNQSGSSYDFDARLYNSRLGRWMSRDPMAKSFPMLTPYQFASNTPIQAIDLDGLEGFVVTRTGYNVGQGQTTVVTDNNLKWATYTIVIEEVDERFQVIDPVHIERNKPFFKEFRNMQRFSIPPSFAGTVFSETLKGVQDFDQVKNLIQKTVEDDKRNLLAMADPVGSTSSSTQTYSTQQVVYGETFTKDFTATATWQVTGNTAVADVTIQAVNINSDQVQKLGRSLTKMGYNISFEAISADELGKAQTLNIEDKANPGGVAINYSVSINPKTTKTTVTRLDKVTHNSSGQTINNPGTD